MDVMVDRGWSFRSVLVGIGIGVFLMVVFVSGAAVDRVSPLPFLGGGSDNGVTERIRQTVLSEESVVIDVAERMSPSVVTVTAVSTRASAQSFFLDPFGFFESQDSGEPEIVEQDIGTGFVVSEDGLIVTNKHVVGGGNVQSYKVVLKDSSEYEVTNIWRDPLNDLAILKIDASGLPVAELGDSEGLKVGQFVVAIGTALGEFRHTVTTGVISGLGRGIQAGDAYGGFVETLDNVIQTDAAINPGNSGGPLLNSAGQVIGVNVAVSQGGQNIGFAIPINVIKDSIKTFNETGQFNRATLGVRYREIGEETALLNDVPAGAYIVEVIDGTAADESGIQVGDIITHIDGVRLSEVEGGLAKIMLEKKVGQGIKVDYFRAGESLSVSIVLKGSE